MFSWDPNKAISNFEKHEVSFEEASSVFSDELALDWFDKTHSVSEIRNKRLGLSISGRIIILIYTIRADQSGKERIRIISARKANKKEKEAYENQKEN
jgi:uncharacterized protein